MTSQQRFDVHLLKVMICNSLFLCCIKHMLLNVVNILNLLN